MSAKVYKVHFQTRGRKNPGCPWEQEGVMYDREFVVCAESEEEAVAMVRQQTDIGDYRGEKFFAVPCCLICNGEGKIHREDFVAFTARTRTLSAKEQMAAFAQRESEARPCPECQN